MTPVSNVLLISIDSLRVDHLATFGYDRETAPVIDQLAETGVSFTEAIANGPNTPSSFPSILTGTYPLFYGGHRYLSKEDRPFLARILRDHGFTTVGYHSNPHLGSEQNYDVGFETFNDTAEGSDQIASIKDRIERKLNPDSMIYSFLRRAWHHFSMTTDTSAYGKASTVTGHALDWFDDVWDGEDRFFMWLHYMDTHYPFMPPDRFLEELGLESYSNRRVAELNGKMQEHPEDLTEQEVQALIELYDGEIRHVDHYIGQVLSVLKERDVLEETAVFVLSDHGEAFGEHGRFGHHPYLYDELLRVPLLVQAPDIESRQIDQQVSLIDLCPTVCDLVGVDIPDAIQGQSLVPLFEGAELVEGVTICTAAGGQMMACRTSRWKCFWQVQKDEIELYDLGEDPDENVDVSEEHPETVEKFRNILEHHLIEADSTDVKVPDPDHSAEVKTRLRELGYLNE